MVARTPLSVTSIRRWPVLFKIVKCVEGGLCWSDMDTVVTYLTCSVRSLSIKYCQSPCSIFRDKTRRVTGIKCSVWGGACNPSACTVSFIKSTSLFEAATCFTSTKFGTTVAGGGGGLNFIGLYLTFLQRFTYKRILTKPRPKRPLLKVKKMLLKIYHFKRS
jgi:hypothetical protein